MKQHTHLSGEERKEIFRMLSDGHKQNAIAEALGRDPGTVSREISRNSTVFPKSRNAAMKSVTRDNGGERARHRELSEALGGVPVYFARPYHSWERGTNEHSNGMSRRFFPKGTDFDKVTDAQLRAAVDAVNDLPRKIFGYKTANEVFDECLSTLS